MLLSLILLSCGKADIELSEDSAAAPGGDDSGEVSGDTDAGTAGDTDTGGPGPGETGGAGDTDTGGAWTEAQVSKVSTRLHEEIESLIYVSWEQGAAATVSVEYSFDEGEWHTTPPVEAAAGPVEQLLLGVPYGYEVTLRVVNDFGGGAVFAAGEVTAVAGALPEGLPLPELVSSVPDALYPEGRYLYTSINGDTGGWTSGDYWKLIFDRQARVVWAHLTPYTHWTIWTEISYDGDDLMWDEATVWSFGSTEESRVHRMKIDGTVVETYETPGLHHAWVELADGSIAWGARITSNEEHLQVLAPDGTVETVWRCSDYEVEMIGRPGSSCHSNAWYWHEPSDTFLVSFPSSAGNVRDTVLHMERDGATITSWGQLGGWTFDPPTSVFDYQHGVSFTEDGHLLVSTKLNEIHPLYDRTLDTLAVREYALDYKTRTLTEVWSFGEDQGIAGNTAGEAHRLPNGNTLHNYGSGARTREITPGGELVWDVKWSDGDSEGRGRLQGRSVFIGDLYDFAP
jgi:hypothetical protein